MSQRTEPDGPNGGGGSQRRRQRRRHRHRRHHRGPLPPDILYHATSRGRLDRLRERQRLEIRGGRPVYLSSSEHQAWHIAHRSMDEPMVLYIDVSRARRAGCRFSRNGQGLWQVDGVPFRHILNLCDGFAHQASAGGIPVYDGPDGPELLLIRVLRRHNATWEVAKGKLEPGETPPEAAIREVQEEIGRALTLEIERGLGAIRYGFFTPDGSPRLKTLHMFLMRTPERVVDFTPAEGESIVDVGWFTPQEAARATSHRSLRPLMKRVCHDIVAERRRDEPSAPAEDADGDPGSIDGAEAVGDVSGVAAPRVAEEAP